MARTKASTLTTETNEKVSPIIEIQNLPNSILIGTETAFGVHTIPNDYAETMIEVLISYTGALSRENGGLSLYYEDETGWHELLEDRFGPQVGFPLMDLTSNFKVIGNQVGDTTVTLSVKQKDDGTELCSTSQSVSFIENLPEPSKYTVTVNGGEGSGTYEAGANITIKAVVPENKEFVEWQVSEIIGTNPKVAEFTFVMPESDVICTAVFKDIEVEPEPTPITDTIWYYIVNKEGLTFKHLAIRFNMKLNRLLELNNESKSRDLIIGERILIEDDGTEKAVPKIDYHGGLFE